MRGYAETRWGQVHYRSSGDAGPVVVLLHESPLSSLAYRAALPEFAGSARAFAFDTPGYGESDPPPAQTEIPEYATTLLEAAEALGLERFAVVGVHTGASLALQMALQAGPQRVTHIVMSGVPVMTPEERAHYLATWAPPVEPNEAGDHFRWAWERYLRIWRGPASMLHIGATLLLTNLEHYFWAYNAAFRYDPEPDLARLEIPTLFLTAENDLLIASDRRAVVIVPGSRLQVVPGHVGQLPMRVPAEFAAEVISFISG